MCIVLCFQIQTTTTTSTTTSTSTTEGILQKHTTSRRSAERYVFLLDNLIIFTKPNNTRRSSVSTQSGEYRLKEKFQVRRLDVVDRSERDDSAPPHSFELHVRDQHYVLAAKTAEEKANWMAALVLQQKRR